MADIWTELRERDAALNMLRREQAEHLGVPEDWIKPEIVNLDMLGPTAPGIFIKIQASGLDLFDTPSWQHLGVNTVVAMNMPPHSLPKYLIEPNVAWFRQATQRVKRKLEKIGLYVGVMHPYRWVEAGKWQKFLEWCRPILAEWEQRRQQIVANYNAHLRYLDDTFTRLAAETYQVATTVGEEVPTKEEFTHAMVAQARAWMPTPEDIEEQLVLRCVIPAFIFPFDLEEKMREAAQIRQEREREERLAQRQLELELEMENIRGQVREDALRAEVLPQQLEHYRRQAESLQVPLQWLLGQLLREVYGISDSVLKALETHTDAQERAEQALRQLSQIEAQMENLGRTYLGDIAQEIEGLVEGIGQPEQPEEIRAVLLKIRDLIDQLVTTKDQILGVLLQIAEGVGDRDWRCLCLNCGRVWQSHSPMAPVFCPTCRTYNVVCREGEQEGSSKS